MTKPGCPFCRENDLLKGPVLAVSDAGYLIESISDPGRYLIIPTAHVESLTDLQDGWWGDVKALLPQVPGLASTYNVSVNIGKPAGQTVPHLHFWIITRQAGGRDAGLGLAGLIAQVNQA